MFKLLISIIILTNDITSAYRLRNLEVVTTNHYIPCIQTITSNLCECPGKCMELVNNNTECALKKCYGWNSNLNKCEQVGPKFIPAIVLQAIPFTGMFGSGFGNMNRWDLFGMYMGVIFGPFILLILGCCCWLVCTKESYGQDNTELTHCISKCFGCLWGTTICSLWIWGIVVIANKEVLGPPVIWYNQTVSCPLV